MEGQSLPPLGKALNVYINGSADFLLALLNAFIKSSFP